MCDEFHIQNLDKMWESYKIGTFVRTSTILVGVVVDWMGMFMLIMLPNGSIRMCDNRSCRPMSPPIDSHYRSMVPKTLVYIMEGRYKGTYGRIIGCIKGRVFLKPEHKTLTEYLHAAGPYERHICVVNCEDVYIV